MNKILIHHHAVAYQNQNGIWISSFIGNWINSLANHFETVGLLVHVSEIKSTLQDTCLKNKNVILHSLGQPGNFWNKISKTIRIKKVCRSLNNQYDYLLIRGITPRQYLVWNNIEVKTSKKYFLLVGSLDNSYSLSRVGSLSDLYYYLMERYRRNELRLIMQSGFLFVNALNLIEKANRILNVKASYAPTNTLTNKDFTDFRIKKINDPIRLFFCGRIEVKKGVLEAIKSVSILNRKGLHVRLDLVGPFIDDKFYSEAILMIKDLNISNHIKFHGSIPYGEEIFKYFQKADIFILPSYTEGFPHVIWEAAANCCPVLATSVGGIPSLFEHKKYSILFPPKDPQAIADSIMKIIKDVRLRKTIVTNAYSLAKDYTVEGCASRLYNLVKKNNA